MRYTFVQQQDTTDCAAACLAMICLHCGKETTIAKLRDMRGTDIKGTNLIWMKKQCFKCKKEKWAGVFIGKRNLLRSKA